VASSLPPSSAAQASSSIAQASSSLSSAVSQAASSVSSVSSQASVSSAGASRSSASVASSTSRASGTSSGAGAAVTSGTLRTGSAVQLTTTNSKGQTVTLSGNQDADATSIIVYSSALLATQSQAFTTTYLTVINGQTVSATSSGTRLATVTTGFVTATNPAQLVAGGGNGSSSGGLSSSTKAIIGGVVGGIGGAMILGALAVVAWRLWGRKGHGKEDEDDLMSASHYDSNSEKPMSSGTIANSGMTNSGYSGGEVDRYNAPHLNVPANAAQNF